MRRIAGKERKLRTTTRSAAPADDETVKRAASHNSRVSEGAPRHYALLLTATLLLALLAACITPLPRPNTTEAPVLETAAPPPTPVIPTAVAPHAGSGADGPTPPHYHAISNTTAYGYAGADRPVAHAGAHADTRQHE